MQLGLTKALLSTTIFLFCNTKGPDHVHLLLIIEK